MTDQIEENQRVLFNPGAKKTGFGCVDRKRKENDIIYSHLSIYKFVLDIIYY